MLRTVLDACRLARENWRRRRDERRDARVLHGEAILIAMRERWIA